MRNLACSLILTVREDEFYEGLYQSDGKTAVAPPAKKGRIVTTLHKAKEVRPLIEKCITIAKKALPHEEQARRYSVDADRNTDEWRSWRSSDQWKQWSAARAPAVAARRRVFQILRDKEAVALLFDEIAPRFEDRPGGFTRVLRLAKPRLGDAGVRAILEFVGENDRIKKRAAAKPAFDDQEDESIDSGADAVGESEDIAEPEADVDENEAVASTDEAAGDENGEDSNDKN